MSSRRALARAALQQPYVATVLSILGCASEPGELVPQSRSLAVSAEQAAAACANTGVVSELDCSVWTVDTPFRNELDGSVAGLLDGAGQSTGFTAVLAASAAPSFVPSNIEVRASAGELALTTAAGIAHLRHNDQQNTLGVALGLPGGVVRVSTTLLSPPAGSGAYEQAGLWFGLNQQNQIKLVFMSAPDALVIQALLEQDDVGRDPRYLQAGAAFERLRLSLEIDSLRREIRAYAAFDGAAERLVGSFPGIDEEWLRLGSASTAPLAGIFATHRRRAPELGPLTYRFDDFSLERRLALPDTPAALGAEWTAVEALQGTVFSNPTQILEAPGTGHLFVSQREGRVYAVPVGGGEKRTVLDLSAVTQGHQDCGLMGLALHPEFGDPSSPSGQYLYVHYAFADPPMRPPVALSARTESRLSRFSVDLSTLAADPGSELVLIAQQDENVWHQGGGMFFHPDDGFLYLSVGDEGGSLCAFDNCQRVDRDLFGGVLRIDVDQVGGALSHPIERQPASGATAGYFIPSDNPFVGTGGLEEFYALGLRSPHRMTYDPVDDIAWIGDVGQNRREEINVLRRAANYQWPHREGTLERLEPPLAPLGVWTDPVLELGREEAMAVIGGLVYRGGRFPELAGKYIFGDFVYGSIWALSYERRADEVRALSRERLLTGLLDRTGTITSFGSDAAGELYVLTMGSGPALRLERNLLTETVPARLSEVGAFDDLATLAPSSGLVPYGVRVPLYSDGSEKRRWMRLPDGGQIGFAEDGPYTFPAGTVFVKHFDIALDEREPDLVQRLETRFLVSTEEGYYGVTYRWNAEGTDATAVLDGSIETLLVTGKDGSVREQPYFYPGPRDCLVCHTAEAGHVLGVRTAQLNGVLVEDGAGQLTEQLSAWSELGLFADGAPLDAAALAALPSLAGLDDESRSLEDRVRSYLDANCSMCHGAASELRATWDGRYQTPLEEQGLIDGPLSGEADLPEGSRVVAPGDLGRSALWQRDASNDPELRMPPLGRQTVDERWLSVLERWISSLPASP